MTTTFHFDAIKTYMKTQYKDGLLSIDVQALFDAIPDDEKVSLIETLSCQDSVIKHVTDQILDGWTERGFYGSIACTAIDDPVFGLDWACRQVAKRAGEVAAKEIKRLEDALRHSESQLREFYIRIDKDRSERERL